MQRCRAAAGKGPARDIHRTCIHRNFHQEKNLTNFAIGSQWQNFYHANIKSLIISNIEDMVTSTALAKFFISLSISAIQT
jgi:hypothetical protein